MNEIYSPNKKDIDAQAARQSPMSQMRYGAMQVQTDHGFLSFLVKSAMFLNGGSWVTLWGLFRMKNLFPPHDAPFMSAIGWYFVFGGLAGLVSFFIFNFAKFTESQAIVKALTQNRRYEWHSSGAAYSDEEKMQQVAESQKRAETAPSAAVGAGAYYFRMTGFICMAALAIWFLGIGAFFSDLI